MGCDVRRLGHPDESCPSQAAEPLANHKERNGAFSRYESSTLGIHARASHEHICEIISDDLRPHACGAFGAGHAFVNALLASKLLIR